MLLALGYLLLASAIVAHEITRKKELQFDQLSIATGFFLANIVLPAIVLHLILDSSWFEGVSLRNTPVLNFLYHRVTGTHRLLVFAGTAVSYIALVLGYRSIKTRDAGTRYPIPVMHRVRVAWLLACIAFTQLMLMFGDALVPGSPLKGLLLSVYFRAEDPGFAFQRTALTANIYSITHTFLLVSVLGYALAPRLARWRIVFHTATASFTLLAVVASGARRSLMIAALLVYVYTAARDGQYRLRALLVMLVLSVPLLYSGKAVLRTIGTEDGPIDAGASAPASEQILVAASELGVSHVESLGTVAVYSEKHRFGIDHVLSVLRFLPDQLVGLEIPWPERIVRISTEYLIGDPREQDIPPGYIGQCWLDFNVLGFVIVPFMHGLAFAFAARWFRRFDLRNSPVQLMAYVVAGYVVALPFNSGTLDFVFSVDVAATALLLFGLHVLSRGRAVVEQERHMQRA